MKIGADRRLLCQKLDSLASAARERALARTRFTKLQESVRNVFTSTPCQTFLALLIFAVTISQTKLSRTRFPSEGGGSMEGREKG